MKKYQRQPSPFIQMQICLLAKRKIGKFMAKLSVLWYDKKPTSLQSNGMTAIPKMKTQFAVNQPVENHFLDFRRKL